ncbi:zinc finger and SCAN domain containing 32, partial [Chelydra serpentina]
GDETVLAELWSKRRNANTYAKVSKGMQDRGYNRDVQLCRVKIKELRQAYQKTRDANSCSGSEPQTCRFYDELHAILGGAASTDPPMWYDSICGSSETIEEPFWEEEDDDNHAQNSAQTQQGSGEALFP